MKTLVLVLMAAAGPGCSTLRSAEMPPPATAAIRGAVPLAPASTDPNQVIWVFLESESAERSGVYRCRAVAEQPVCTKADW